MASDADFRRRRATYPDTSREPRSNGIRGPKPFLVLLQVGFAVPPMSPPTRWALTPPFHPYPV